ncbi:AraC family transcriptional regulator ligand-binding domain-containing protein [Shimia sediminis]|uniref:AraC family transcriptional regulator ligand-binding domain-containing protein n=1 Tax=Shimia sediminis TaxID=2497945 RepID=UPI0027B9AE78|nr:AraC family transcriptional regulator ligand-binding domain-containing protein [Shimia sediminis]
MTTVREATSLASALYRFSTFWNLLLDDYQFDLDDTDSALVLTLKPQGDVPLQRFGHMLILKLAHGLLSWLAGHEVPVKAVDFAFDRPEFDQDYAIIFPAPLRFGQPATAISFDPNALGPVQTRSTAGLDRFLQNAPRDWIFTSSRETHPIAAGAHVSRSDRLGFGDLNTDCIRNAHDPAHPDPQATRGWHVVSGRKGCPTARHRNP